MLAAALEAVKAPLAACSQAELLHRSLYTPQRETSSFSTDLSSTTFMKVPLAGNIKLDTTPCLNQTPLPHPSRPAQRTSQDEQPIFFCTLQSYSLLSDLMNSIA